MYQYINEYVICEILEALIKRDRVIKMVWTYYEERRVNGSKIVCKKASREEKIGKVVKRIYLE